MATINMKLTHADIANMIGSTREAVLGQLKKDGLLKKGLRLLDYYKVYYVWKITSK
jgi:CRP-like cAMP-binding protein